jgi:hypothetical protein
VHGHAGTGSAWTPLRRELAQAGFGHIVTLNYNSFAADPVDPEQCHVPCPCRPARLDDPRWAAAAPRMTVNSFSSVSLDHLIVLGEVVALVHRPQRVA